MKSAPTAVPGRRVCHLTTSVIQYGARRVASVVSSLSLALFFLVSATQCGGTEPAEIWACDDSVGQGTSCICTWNTASFFSSSSKRVATCDDHFNGGAVVCCAGNTFPEQNGDFGDCTCYDATRQKECRAGELAVTDCTAPIPMQSTSGGTASTGASPACDLKAASYYADCSSGCGDVMVCQSFCDSCSLKCMVPCVDNSDCQRVGAGTCETASGSGSNRCSSAPSKCP